MYKKMIGTVMAVGTLLGGIALIATPETFAAYISSVFSTVADGTVENVDSSSFTLQTSGGETQEIIITDRTIIRGGPLEPGDHVRVTTRGRDGNVTAVVIRIEDDEGSYGTSGDPVVVQLGSVISKGVNQMTIDTNAGPMIFQITPSTRFVGETFGDTEPGDRVTITGYDTGSSFVARTVVVQ